MMQHYRLTNNLKFLIFGIIIISSSYVYAVTNQFLPIPNFIISTPTGSENIVSSSTVKIFSDSSGNLEFLAPRATYVSQVAQLQWDSNLQNDFINDQMNTISVYSDILRHGQTLNGTYFSITITPIVNTMDQPITLKLLDNSVFTGNLITIQPNDYTVITQKIDYNFNQGDNLIWKITGRTSNANSLNFNAQVIIDYNK